ncbi:MAG: 16S rRNA (cytidine(1402)-2'-O)-methyltransferase [Heliobacteriaceae bacterium]|jgi:16S rRNA (cytidine1402-2'-O)-methyltransferase|nr:16S rRNA (cytidine(1402)-2'-O)-methyltransferase [Heliobacteriaceae bacterium]
MKEYNFYIVPTPIGNLGDITNRAVEVLKSVDIIACEDSRVTQKLLNHFGIKTKCLSYHKFNEKERVGKILEILKNPPAGKTTMALVSDAGTPLFCDPGKILIEELRKHNIKITALPGANAVATFLSQIPRENEDFYFAGFLPKTQTAIENLLEKYKFTDVVFYDSPNRLLNTMKAVRPHAKVAIGRELTKVFEEIIIDTPQNIINHFENNILKGEIVGLVFREESASLDEAIIKEKIAALKAKNFKAREISVILSEIYNISKNYVYKLTAPSP